MTKDEMVLAARKWIEIQKLVTNIFKKHLSRNYADFSPWSVEFIENKSISQFRCNWWKDTWHLQKFIIECNDGYDSVSKELPLEAILDYDNWLIEERKLYAVAKEKKELLEKQHEEKVKINYEKN